MTVCGYQTKSGKEEIYCHSNKIEITAYGGKYDIDTLPGHSGSPVYLNDEPLHIVGIHKGYNHEEKLNICCLTTR